MKTPTHCTVCGVALSNDNDSGRCFKHTPAAIARRAKEQKERAELFATIRKKHGV